MNIRLMFRARVTKFHSPLTLSRPRRWNCRKPITDLMMPNAGSGICLRLASVCLPLGVASRCSIACNAVASSGAGAGWANHSFQGRWWRSLPAGISSAIFASAYAVTFASLKYPLSASRVSVLPNVSGRRSSSSSIGWICCLSWAACTTSLATTSKLSVATAAWAL